ncbi:MAG: thioredoxin [Nanoarchaeota archaeon]
MKELTQETFEEAIKEGATIVDFWAPWCGPCQQMAPVFEGFAKEYEGKVAFAKVNVDEQGALAQQFGVRSIPTLIIFNKGEKVEELIGFGGKDTLRAKIDKVLTKI